MRHMRVPVFCVLVVLLLTASSFAGRVNLIFENVGPGNQIGGDYAYPYNFSINSSGTFTALICDTYNRNIVGGEKWQANEHKLLWAGGLYSSQNDYKAAAIIFNEILFHGASATDGNLAIWALFDDGKSNPAWATDTNAHNLYNNALASTGMYGANFYSHFEVYTPLAGNKGMGAQEFIGYNAVPEPASLPMLGSELLILAGLLRLRPLRPRARRTQ